MCHHDAPFAEFHKLRQDRLDRRCGHDHLIIDAGQFLNPKRDWNLRINKGAEFIGDFPVYNLYCADLNDLILYAGKACRLQVKDHKGIMDRLSLCVYSDLL